MEKRAIYLADLIALTACNSTDICRTCKGPDAHWKCMDCIGHPLQCKACCHDSHALLPFHRVEKWTGQFFRPAWLQEVGIIIHLGHNGLPCPRNDDENPFEDFGDMDIDESDGDSDWENEVAVNDADGPGLSAFTDRAEMSATATKGTTPMCVVDRSGIHPIPVHWCRCPGHLADDRQLFAMGLFPSTFKRIRTAFTFQVLDDFRIDNLECKTAASAFYQKLKRITSNAFPASVKVFISMNLKGCISDTM